ncbi:NRAMP family divalent metal transporter [Aestuariivirga litoralis]|uniref:NRAMP family divalent metal transporter n=1 Tax=Aestuariivirga litoralis TaxID=2650924 RepID=UPI0018C4E625|nr:divalent metal cation transporter [Aestuariivirga litoralis]MBG1231196.1 divalent metal cation transporter [Aestuariivirga litoralis]
MTQQNAMTEKPAKIGFLRSQLNKLGPGLIAGAADDDPSGIATYSVAGAQFGLGLLWLSWFSWPLMAFVQMMCARIGMVTGVGLAGALRQRFPRPVLIVACFALLAANSINVGADLSGMADAAELLTGISSHVYVVLLGGLISYAVIRFRYHHVANVLKWLALTLVAYIVTGFLVKPQWGAVFSAFAHISIPANGGFGMVVAILGTTISPYLFFWQAAQEVEEQKAMGRRMLKSRQHATTKEIKDRVFDVAFGTLSSNVVMFFVILCTALTLNANGMTTITSSKEVAEALRPLAGNGAMLLYTVGIVGVGLLAIPTLTGSAAYAFSETFHWRGGLDEKWRRARAFYGIIIFSTLIGIAMDWLSINPVAALYWTAVINGVLAPFLLVGILMVARDQKIMLGQPSSIVSQVVVGITIILMFGAAVAMFLT